MSREVTHTERGPYRLTADDIDEKYGDVAICQCGLSGTRPFCDGSHRQTEDEESGVRYKYVDGERRVVRMVYEEESPEIADAARESGPDHPDLSDGEAPIGSETGDRDTRETDDRD